MKTKIAVPDWIARELAPFEGIRVRLSRVTVSDGTRESRIELTVSDKAVAHPPRRPEPAEVQAFIEYGDETASEPG